MEILIQLKEKAFQKGLYLGRGQTILLYGVYYRNKKHTTKGTSKFINSGRCFGTSMKLLEIVENLSGGAKCIDLSSLKGMKLLQVTAVDRLPTALKKVIQCPLYI